MIRAPFRSALRVLYKKKSFSLLNIVGLAVGIAASLLIFLIIRNEYSYDAYHKNADRIFRVVTAKSKPASGEIVERSSGVPGPLSEAMRLDFPQLEKVAPVWDLGQAQIYVPGVGTQEEKRFKEDKGLFWVDPSLFDILEFHFVAGNASGLKDPNKAVICESFANKFFGSAQAAIGKNLQLWSFRIPFEVAGVFKDVPANTDVPLQFGPSYVTLQTNLAQGAFTAPDAWNYQLGNNQCFVLKKEGQSINSMTAQLPAFIKKYYPPSSETDHQLFFQPLKAVHLNSSDFGTFRHDSFSKTELWSLGLIGSFLLLVACINFINLATAQSVNRAKEIGVRKVLGGNRGQLILQFLSETAILAIIAVIVASLLAAAFVPLLNELLRRELSMNLFTNPSILFYLCLTAIVVTLLAGFYPAMVLSGFQPATVFKYKVRTKAGGIYLRRGLVVFQFVIAQLLIIGTVVVMKQMKFFQDRPLGFDKDGVVLINLPSDSTLKLKYPMLKNRMEAVPGVVSAGLCMEAPSANWTYDEDLYLNNEATKKDFPVSRQYADTSYFKTFSLKLIAGRLPFASDSTQEVVANETLVKKLGLKSANELVGQMISNDGIHKFPVVGVVQDYYNKSLREAITPILISSEFNTYEWIAVRIERDRMASTLPEVRKLFTGIYPSYMYDQIFFDLRIERFYRNEATTSKLFKIFSLLAIMISCLGLYGLVSFMAIQKTKEVGIRKVLGASVQSIVYLFSREFTILIGIAFVIAAPLGYYLMHGWLSGFYYHTSIGAGVFVLAIIASIFIAWLTVGYKAVKAALINPVKSLKSE